MNIEEKLILKPSAVKKMPVDIKYPPYSYLSFFYYTPFHIIIIIIVIIIIFIIIIVIPAIRVCSDSLNLNKNGNQRASFTFRRVYTNKRYYYSSLNKKEIFSGSDTRVLYNNGHIIKKITTNKK